MKTNAVHLRRNMKDIMRAVDRNEPVTILYHGKEKATICAIEQITSQPVVRHPFFGMNQDEVSVEAVIDELRGVRY